MQNKSELTHEAMKDLLQNDEFISLLRSEQGNIKQEFHSLKTQFDQQKEHDLKQYCNWVIKEFNTCLVRKIENATVLFIKKNRKAVMSVRFPFPHDEIKHLFPKGNKQRAIELDQLHSFQKGEGIKLLKKVIGFSERIGRPILLWTETDRASNYFRNFGFKDKGLIGIDGERLLIRVPK